MTLQIDKNSLTPLEDYLTDPDVMEILVDGYKQVYVERHGKLEDVPSHFRDDDHLLDVIRAIINPLGREINESNPIVDARLADGSRINAVIPPIALQGPVLTLRKMAKKALTFDDLIGFGSLVQDMVTFFEACIQAKLNMVVSGNANSGKTTVLNLIGSLIPAHERIICVQDATEFQLPQKRVVTLEARPANFEGKGEISLQNLVFNAMRMRPDRIVIGEVRGAEVMDIIQAINAGYIGTLINMHATSPRDVLTRLEGMATHTGVSMPLLTIRQMIASAIDIIAYQEHLRDGSRKIVKIAEVVGMQGDMIMLQDIFEFKETGLKNGKIIGYATATGIIPNCLERIKAAGVDLPVTLFTPTKK